MLFSAQEYLPKGYSGLVCALAAEILKVTFGRPFGTGIDTSRACLFSASVGRILDREKHNLDKSDGKLSRTSLRELDHTQISGQT
jgi:hypothetical protein